MVTILLGFFGFIQFNLGQHNALVETTGAFAILDNHAFSDQITPYSEIFNDFNNYRNESLKNVIFSNVQETLVPLNAPITSIPEVIFCQGSLVDIPVVVFDFNNIGAVSLKLDYDPSVLVYQSFSANTAFSGLTANGSIPGVIVAGGYSGSTQGVTLNSGAVLFIFQFHYLGGTSSLFWNDNGISCEYTGPSPEYIPLNDIPYNLYYDNGLIEELLLPALAGIITGPVGGNVCIGETGVIFSVEPIDNAESYDWLLPLGATIIDGEGTNLINVSFGNDAISGTATVNGINSCGNGALSPVFTVTVSEPPGIFEQPISPEPILAGIGTALFSVLSSGPNLSYQWQEYIFSWTNITDGGVYAGTISESLAIIAPPLSMNGLFYRCIVSNNCDPPSVTDGNAVLTVNNLTEIKEGDFPERLTDNKILISVYPNPCQGSAKVTYFIPFEGRVFIEIQNLVGETIEILTDHPEINGYHHLFFDTDKYGNGIYFIRISLLYNSLTISNALKIIF